MARLLMYLCVVFVSFSAVLCKPTADFESVNNEPEAAPVNEGHSIWKRFINPDLTFGGFSDSGMTRMRTKRFVNPSLTFGDFADAAIAKMRTRRSYEEECEKLTLCKLHARSQGNFFAAFELYFVNKENAKLWDHHRRSLADCQRRFSGCYDR